MNFLIFDEDKFSTETIDDEYTDENENGYDDNYFREEVSKDKSKGSQFRQPQYQKQQFNQPQQQNSIQQSSYTPVNTNARENTTAYTSGNKSGSTSAIFRVISFVAI